MLKIVSSILSLALIIIITVFAISNRAVVEISMFPMTDKQALPLYAVVLMSIFFGFLWGVMIMSWKLVKIHFKHKTLHSSIKRHIDS